MKKSMINKTHIEGYLYSIDKLELRESGPKSKNPGTQFIMGTVNIATDNACTNIVPVHFTYVTATTSKGGTNATFGVLKDIVDGKLATVMDKGVDAAAKLRIDSAIGLNDFYTERDGKEELVSAKRNEGGFVHTTPSLAEDEKVRNTFEADMIITGATRVEANEERNLPEKVVVKGACFNFRNELLPVEFSATNPNAMNYFEGLEASPKNPVFTKVWGRQISETVVRKITVESAFGEDEVREVPSSRKDWVITGAAKEPYVWDDPSTITAEELTNAMTARQTYLATVKQRADEYKAQRAAGNSAGAPAAGDFNF